MQCMNCIVLAWALAALCVPTYTEHVILLQMFSWLKQRTRGQKGYSEYGQWSKKPKQKKKKDLTFAFALLVLASVHFAHPRIDVWLWSGCVGADLWRRCAALALHAGLQRADSRSACQHASQLTRRTVRSDQSVQSGQSGNGAQQLSGTRWSTEAPVGSKRRWSSTVGRMACA